MDTYFASALFGAFFIRHTYWSSAFISCRIKYVVTKLLNTTNITQNNDINNFPCITESQIKIVEVNELCL
jgi:hypothetical protein